MSKAFSGSVGHTQVTLDVAKSKPSNASGMVLDQPYDFLLIACEESTLVFFFFSAHRERQGTENNMRSAWQHLRDVRDVRSAGASQELSPRRGPTFFFLFKARFTQQLA